MNRRQALQSLALAPWLQGLAQPRAPRGGSARHVIDTFETFRLPVNHRGDWVLLRTSTSSGLRGLGEGSHSGNDERAIALVRQYLQALAGRSIFDIEWLRQWAGPEIAKNGESAITAERRTLTAESYLQAVLHCAQSLGSVPLISTKIDLGMRSGSGDVST